MRFVRHLIRKFHYAFRGLGIAFATDNSFKFHFSFALLVVALGVAFGVSEAEWIALVFAIGLVVVAELFNTAIEHLVRILVKDHHPEAGTLLDIAAGAVLFAALVALVVGLIVLGPRFWSLLVELLGGSLSSLDRASATP